jgi:ComF family protein
MKTRLYEQKIRHAARSLGVARRLFFPPRCAGCDGYLEREGLVCERCRHAVFRIESPLCRICGEPREKLYGGYSGIDAVCGRCSAHRPRFVRARACWEYSGSIADAIQRAKYGERLWILRNLAAELGTWLREELAVISAEVGTSEDSLLLTSVPMHPKDLRARGFDLAHLLLRQCLKPQRRSIRIAQPVLKTRRTPSQASLGYAERRLNLRGAFACHPRADLAGRAVVLFDDVLTTGSTADEIAKTLRRGGASEVYVLSAARAVSS